MWFRLSGFDVVALHTRRLTASRLIGSAITAGLTAGILGMRTAVIWGAAMLACEAGNWLVTAPFARREIPTTAQRLFYVVTGTATNVVWLGLSLAFWLSPEPGLGFFALLVWASLLLNGVNAFRSRESFLVFGWPVAAVMLGAALLAPRYEGVNQFFALAGLAACAGYAMMSTRRNLAAAEALAVATQELAVQKQAAEAANQAKSSFLAMMSHELRTPMNGVLGMAQALAMTKLDARQEDYVRTLIRSGDGLMAILNDVLDLAKIEAGRIEVEPAAFDLHETLAKVRDLWDQSAAEKGLALTCDTTGAPRWVRGDATRVRQILLNLVSNAVKFTSVGEVRLTARMDGELVALSVADTGPGIDAETMPRLFQGFTQADASIARRFGGTGLGLAISRQLAGLMDGDITVVSTPGEGACFTLTLPLTAAEAPAIPQAPAALVAPGVLRALVVDDNRANRDVALALLEAMGLEVVTTADGPAALEAAGGKAFDIVFMDIHMPGMDGIETLRRLRESGAAMPVVALTADAMAGERERLLALGFDGYVSKPISPAGLLAVLGGGVERRSA